MKGKSWTGQAIVILAFLAFHWLPSLTRHHGLSRQADRRGSLSLAPFVVMVVSVLSHLFACQRRLMRVRSATEDKKVSIPIWIWRPQGGSSVISPGVAAGWRIDWPLAASRPDCWRRRNEWERGPSEDFWQPLARGRSRKMMCIHASTCASARTRTFAHRHMCTQAQ